MSGISAEAAVILTTAVEVQALMIGNKQVTLAVFRQLPEAAWLDEDAIPRGPAWGTVNYHPDRCESDPEHQHVVWQDGSVLRRWKMHRNVGLKFWSDAFDVLVLAAWCRSGHAPWYASETIDGWLQINPRIEEASFQMGGIHCGANLPKTSRFRANPSGFHECPGDVEARYGKAGSDAAAAAASEVDRRERWRERYGDAGPQLFIAV